MSSVEGTPTSVEVGAVVVETSAQKSAASKEWNQTLSHDAERKARAAKRSETFKEAQRFFHDIHGEGSIVSRSADGIVVMKFDNGEVHKYDLISQRKLRPIIEDAHTYTAETLFDIVDTDSSGVLEKAEFVYMHTMVQNSEKRAGAKIAEAKRNEAEQRRAKRMVMWALLVAVLLIFVLLGGMLGIAFAANEATKESHVNADGLMTGLDGSSVKTEEVRSYATLYDLPRIETNILARLDQLTVGLAGESAGAWPAVAQATFKVVSALKPSDDEVYLFLASGAVAHIDAANTTARVTLADGATFSVVEDETSASLRRELQEAAESGGGRRLLLSEVEMQSHRRRLRAMTGDTMTIDGAAKTATLKTADGVFPVAAEASEAGRRLWGFGGLQTHGTFHLVLSSF